MGERSCIGRFLGAANSADILLFIRANPGCMRSDIYRMVSRNAHTSEKISRMVEQGLLESTSADGRTFLSLTCKGSELAELLHRADMILGEPEDADAPDGDGSS
ncbi:hypothetical protein JS82_06070 [Methanomassiliicoccaceae archaeon DOK]|nr:hypothetical protein JS82_06070 [Methanomassiliicoccaceae archaeon DOK]